MKKKTFIFDAGGTKTDVRIIHLEGEIESFVLSGYNPNKENQSFLKEIETFSFTLEDTVYFYGSGMGNENSVNFLKQYFLKAETYIYNDLIGAARALIGEKSGIVSIMGTGAVIGFYENQKIVEKIGGYGYLIDDFGGGFELGKIIISNWLRNNFSTQTDESIKNHLGIEKDNFIKTFYQTKNTDTISSICRILIDLSKNDEFLYDLIQKYFDNFTENYLLPFCEKYKTHEININGSIGFHFQHFIKNSCLKNGLILNKLIQYPIDLLVNFHQNEKK